MRSFRLKPMVRSAAQVILTAAVMGDGVTCYGLLCGTALWLAKGLDRLSVLWLERFFVSGVIAGAIVGVCIAVDHAVNFNPDNDSLAALTEEGCGPASSDERLPARRIAPAVTWSLPRGHGLNGCP
jgi:hypothetical protein